MRGLWIMTNWIPSQVKGVILREKVLKNSSLIPIERIERSIFLIRGAKVMLSPSLAELYEVSVKALNQSVRRNRARFPDDFMFQLSAEEYEILKSQIVTSSWGGPRRALPYAFTEQGIAMLSGILRSPRAIRVNIEIMRAFVQLREFLTSHALLTEKINEMEKKYDQQFKIVFDAIRQLVTPPPTRTKPIGFSPKILKKG